MSTDWLNVSATAPRIAYTATASQTVFTVPFVFFEDEDLKVYQNAVLLTLATHYTVFGAEEEVGGTVTLLTGATAGDAILVVREVAIEQTTHIPPSGPLDVAAINIQISKLIAIAQQLNSQFDFTIRGALTDSASMARLPTAGSRALQYLAFDSLGNPIAAAPGGSSTPVSSAMAPVVAAATLQLARAAMGVRATLAADQTYYVNASTGSDANDGLTTGTPFQTIQHAMNLLPMIDSNGHRINIRLAENVGTYAGFIMSGRVVGDNGSCVSVVGAPNKSITGASNASPIVITSASHGYTNGKHVVIHGVRGNMAANGAYLVGSATTDTFALLKEVDGSNSTGNGTYVSGTGLVCAPRNCPVNGMGTDFGANIALGGISLSNSGFSSGQGAYAIRESTITQVGPIDIGQCDGDQFYASRGSYLELIYNSSWSGGSVAGAFFDATHRGEIRKIGVSFYLTANVSYPNFGNFMFTDYGEIVETGSLDAALTVTNATNTTPIVISIANHNYNNGDYISISGVLGNTAANISGLVSAAGANSFSLLTASGANTVGSGTYTSGGSALRITRGISGATNASPIVITCNNHGYIVNDKVVLSNVGGNTAANGGWTISAATANTFTLSGSTGNGAYTSGGFCLGPGIGWNQQGFSVTGGGTLRQFSSTQMGQIQLHGNFPPVQNYAPGNATGNVLLGVAGVSPNVSMTPGSGLILYTDLTGGMIVVAADQATTLLQILNSGAANFASTVQATGAGIGTAPVSTAHLALAAGTTAKALMSLPVSSTPSSPSDGQLWREAGGLKFRDGVTTKTITMA